MGEWELRQLGGTLINEKKVDEQGHVNEYNVTTGRSAALSLTVRLGEKNP